VRVRKLRSLAAWVRLVRNGFVLRDRLSEAGLAVTLSGDGEARDHSLLTARR